MDEVRGSSPLASTFLNPPRIVCPRRLYFWSTRLSLLLGRNWRVRACQRLLCTFRAWAYNYEMHQPVLEPWPSRSNLSNDVVRLTLLASDDLVELWATTEPQTFRYFATRVDCSSKDAFIQCMHAYLSRQDRVHYAVRDAKSGAIVGHSAFYDLRPEHRALEIGFTWFARSHRGTLINPGTKLAMLEHAIETCGAVRVQIKTDSRNVHSQRAILKLGAAFEGRLLNHMTMPDGFVRDTMMYAVTNHMWPRVRERLLERIRKPAQK
jgi:N-acetyltransferase